MARLSNILKYKHDIKEFYADTPHKLRADGGAGLMKHYGISRIAYDELYKAQDGKCAICKEECKRGRELSVDHCHTTGKVRGLLCSTCNIALGLMEDNIQLLECAINYLNRDR